MIYPTQIVRPSLPVEYSFPSRVSQSAEDLNPCFLMEEEANYPLPSDFTEQEKHIEAENE